jgi:hypothetical protein
MKDHLIFEHNIIHDLVIVFKLISINIKMLDPHIKLKDVRMYF